MVLQSPSPLAKLTDLRKLSPIYNKLIPNSTRTTIMQKRNSPIGRMNLKKQQKVEIWQWHIYICNT